MIDFFWSISLSVGGARSSLRLRLLQVYRGGDPVVSAQTSAVGAPTVGWVMWLCWMIDETSGLCWMIDEMSGLCWMIDEMSGLCWMIDEMSGLC